MLFFLCLTRAETNFIILNRLSWQTMPKPTTLAPLTLPSVSVTSKEEEENASITPQSAPPLSPNYKRANVESNNDGRVNRSPVNITYGTPKSPASPRFTSERSRGLFSNLKASKSSTRIVHEQALSHTTNHSNDSAGSIYSHRHSPGSTPELTLVRDRPNTSGKKCLKCNGFHSVALIL